MNGFIKFQSGIENFDWYKDVITKNVYLHILVKGIEKGSIDTSIGTLSKELNLSRTQIRTALKKLTNTDTIKVRQIYSKNKHTHLGTHLTICETDEYRDIVHTSVHTPLDKSRNIEDLLPKKEVITHLSTHLIRNGTSEYSDDAHTSVHTPLEECQNSTDFEHKNTKITHPSTHLTFSKIVNYDEVAHTLAHTSSAIQPEDPLSTHLSTHLNGYVTNRYKDIAHTSVHTWQSTLWPIEITERKETRKREEREIRKSEERETRKERKEPKERKEERERREKEQRETREKEERKERIFALASEMPEKQAIKNIENIEDEKFNNFWHKYHKLSGRSKTDRRAAEKHWKRLTEVEKDKAIENIGAYVESVEDRRYLKKARTYLADKNFNDEFRKPMKKTESGREPKYYDIYMIPNKVLFACSESTIIEMCNRGDFPKNPAYA